MFLIDQVVLTSTSVGCVRDECVLEILSFELQWPSNSTDSCNKLSVLSSVLTCADLSSLSKHALVTSCSIPSGFSRSPSGVSRKSPLLVQSASACSASSLTSSILTRSYDIAGCCGLSVFDWLSSVIYLSVQSVQVQSVIWTKKCMSGFWNACTKGPYFACFITVTSSHI